ncbi:hypothetical protein GCM10010339_87030 [Streptomyces alanosinicus]|uniref:ATP-grasp domain-containing protein n=1 Tax=Streptomyces alanosinicus TaxID=68171 RepID=A0A918YT07_9ACTN|nr:hypothetical protein GCM10010339_87030 [Streptomyces alanosinicus]
MPQPRWAVACDPKSAVANAESLGYPILIKPTRKARELALLAHNREEVSAAYELVTQQVAGCTVAQREDVLIEENSHGHQVSAETVVLDEADIRIAAITRTAAGALSGQVKRHCIFAHDPLLHNPVLRQIVMRTVRALGVTRGVLHVQMTLTPGGPRITDVSAHLADDLIPLLVLEATGIDLPGIAADLSTGRTTNVVPTRQQAAAIQFLYPPVAGYVRRLAVNPQVDSQSLLKRIVFTQKLGNRVTRGPNATAEDQTGHVVVRGPDGPSCHRTLDRIGQCIDTAVAPSSPIRAEATCRPK